MDITVVLARTGGVIAVVFMSIIVGYSTVNDSIDPSYGLSGDALANAVSNLDSSGGVKVMSDGSFNTSNSWNWHLICMTIAFSIAMSESVLSFRAPLFPHRMLNGFIVHVLWQSIALAFVITGVCAAALAKKYIDSSNFGYIVYNMYSTHSWCGAMVIALFAVQYFSGIFVYLLAKKHISSGFIVRFGVWHSNLGKLTVISGLCTCIVGWADYQMMMDMSQQSTYNSASMLEAAISIPIAIQAASLLFFLFNAWPAEGQKVPDAGKTVGDEQTPTKAADVDLATISKPVIVAHSQPVPGQLDTGLA